MRLPYAVSCGPIPLQCVHSNYMLPIKRIRSLDLLDGTPQSPQDHCHKSRRALRSTQEHEIAWCNLNELKMKPDSSALAPEPSNIPHHTRQVA